ncbi:hypothetical protein Vadar_014484 [Vaccinium darrowii]|uniref:Uncharacterized protein n=1 Tax=Vaccinium darrowii TaxID=229202 RepID=A0ACB7Z4R2_9ERIC|nr:hypothetical protein Vadar_014484 [Vaccinium darrowii]
MSIEMGCGVDGEVVSDDGEKKAGNKQNQVSPRVSKMNGREGKVAVLLKTLESKSVDGRTKSVGLSSSLQVSVSGEQPGQDYGWVICMEGGTVVKGSHRGKTILRYSLRILNNLQQKAALLVAFVASATAIPISAFFKAHPTHDKYLDKKIEMYDEIALVVSKDRAKGNFAKSFGDVDLEARPEIEPIHLDDENAFEDISKDKNAGKQSACSSRTSSQPRAHRKRGRLSDIKTISDKLGQVADAITRLTWDRLVCKLFMMK